jgi:hypothetical protein
MIGESQIIVAAERDDTPAVDDLFGPLRSLSDAAHAIELLDAALFKSVCEISHVAMGRDVKAFKSRLSR